jgi:hypothetical protein
MISANPHYSSKMTIAFGLRLEDRELRSLEDHPPLADLRPIHFSLQPQASCKRAILKRSDPACAGQHGALHLRQPRLVSNPG